MRFDPQQLHSNVLDVTEKLRQPAGPDERFQSFEGIRSNYGEFTTAVHKTWRAVHFGAVDEIVRIEDALVRGPDVEDFRSYLRVTRQILRKVTDAMVWTVCGHKRHLIKRMCKHRTRALLKDSNLKDSLYILREFNQLDEEIALWTDASSCADIGDFLYLGPKVNGGPAFLELKAGRVNEAIGTLLETKGEQEQIVGAIGQFAKQYGPKAMKQLDRTLRQSATDDQLLEIVAKDQGFDPILKADVIVRDPGVQEQSYDDQLERWLTESVDGDVLKCVDGCLYVFIQRGDNSYEERLGAFVSRLRNECPDVVRWHEENIGNPRDAILTLDRSTFDPLSMPLFLRQLSAIHVADILHGPLLQRVCLFFDWDQFGKLVVQAGGEFLWSTRRAGRRARAKPGGQGAWTIGDRIPRVQLPNGFGMQLGASEFLRIWFDGIRPFTIAEEFVSLLRGFPAGPGEVSLD